MGISIRLLLLACIGLVAACSQNNPFVGVGAHMKTFDHVLTDQYVWYFGQGGIFWVSNDHVVLEAIIKNDLGVLDRGIYQVDVRDGAFLKLVDVPEKGPYMYKYCFDGAKLHVMRVNGAIELVHQPKSYDVEVRARGGKTSSNYYSPLRCRMVERPSDGRYLKALRLGDGFIEYHHVNELERDIFLTNKEGKRVKHLIKKKLFKRFHPAGLFTVKRFLENKNAYFGHSPKNYKDCTEIWWLYRDKWQLENKKLCFEKWAKGGSRIIHDLKDALYLEHYTGAGDRSYVLFDEKVLPVETDHGRGAVVSPDGCIVAYGVGRSNRKSGMRQRLKIFNYCKYRQ